ncbi:MAG: hypothetical protein JJU12_07575 [Chlamydiales bacterium]|nr:hypothetical protein [Chlamydiales bacterium]
MTILSRNQSVRPLAMCEFLIQKNDTVVEDFSAEIEKTSAVVQNELKKIDQSAILAETFADKLLSLSIHPGPYQEIAAESVKNIVRETSGPLPTSLLDSMKGLFGWHLESGLDKRIIDAFLSDKVLNTFMDSAAFKETLSALPSLGEELTSLLEENKSPELLEKLQEITVEHINIIFIKLDIYIDPISGSPIENPVRLKPHDHRRDDVFEGRTAVELLTPSLWHNESAMHPTMKKRVLQGFERAPDVALNIQLVKCCILEMMKLAVEKYSDADLNSALDTYGTFMKELSKQRCIVVSQKEIEDSIASSKHLFKELEALSAGKELILSYLQLFSLLERQEGKEMLIDFIQKEEERLSHASQSVRLEDEKSLNARRNSIAPYAFFIDRVMQTPVMNYLQGKRTPPSLDKERFRHIA